MKKYLLLTTFLTFGMAQVYAQSADLASAISGGDEASEQTYEKEKLNENVADDRGLFSFLNFSFIKKPISAFFNKTTEEEIQNTEDNVSAKEEHKYEHETPLEKATRLAKEGDVDSALTLGYMYLYGQDGVKADYKKAFYFYQLAAKTNNAVALTNLGSLYFNGIGTDVDYEKAAQLFLQASQLGSNDAAVNLAFIYLSLKDPSYYETAVKLFEQAAKSDDKTAEFMLGYAYYRGFVVQQDFHKAVQLIRKSADANFDEAHYVMANIYANGEGIAQNYGSSVKHYRAAISQGNVESMMELAQILTEGKMFPQNLVEAHVLYNIASVYGAPQAAENRNTIEEALQLEGLLEAQNVAEGFKESPSELTQYIRKTFGPNIRLYIDNNLRHKGVKIEKNI